MVADPKRQKLGVEDYLLLEQHSGIRHEYIDGYMYAMSGGTVEHSWLAMNMVRLLDEQLQSGPCRVFNSDVQVQLSEKRYVFPDVTVSCDIADSKRGNGLIRSPRLVVEVLSPTTELYDRGKKCSFYQECLPIQEYIMVNTQHQMLEIYRRTRGDWTYQRYWPGQNIKVKSLDIHIPFDAIYARVRVPIEEDGSRDEIEH